MAVDVVMPQMGESIAEGTVTRWIKKQGDRVERDEPLFEISTDKVDAEIPAPAAGVLAEILAPEGKTVPVNSVVARLQVEGEASVSPQAKPQPQDAEKPAPQPKSAEEPREAETRTAEAELRTEPREPRGAQPTSLGAAAQPRAAVPHTAAPPQRPSQPQPQQTRKVTSIEEGRRTRSSPLVRKIARENDVDITRIEGTGISGRVTKRDILQYLESPQPQEQPDRPSGGQAFPAAMADRIEPMSVMRRRIAEHMVASKRIAAHVNTVWEVDFTKVDQLRRKYKQSYADRGARLTYMPFIVQAVIAGIREFPIMNASIEGDNVIYRGEINIGIAVSLDWGLIVPVIRHTDEKTVLGLARAISDVGERARSKKLNPEEVQGGTFTITNPGSLGGLFGTPIINQPQAAILGVGGVKKRPIVIETDEGDAIVIRSMAYLALTFDHRLIDGAVADQFMSRVASMIESGNFTM